MACSQSTRLRAVKAVDWQAHNSSNKPSRWTLEGLVTRNNPEQKSLGQRYSFHNIYENFGFPHKTVHPFRNFLVALPPLTYTMLVNLGKKSGYTRPTLFVGWGAGLNMSELKKALQMQKCPKTFAHDWSHETETKRLNPARRMLSIVRDNHSEARLLRVTALPQIASRDNILFLPRSCFCNYL